MKRSSERSVPLRCSDPVAAKAQTTSVLNGWYRVFVLIYRVWLSLNVPLYIAGKQVVFVFVCAKDIVPEVL